MTIQNLIDALIFIQDFLNKVNVKDYIIFINANNGLSIKYYTPGMENDYSVWSIDLTTGDKRNIT